ncbi:MAG: (2Fe-2S)-binding protein [Pseudomonadota bacterium]|nr:(2Fe-2S)-binding protein [Pseudomonadota bacterium]
MYVCVCKRVTDRQIRELIAEQGAGDLDTLRCHLGVATGCGKCEEAAMSMIHLHANRGDENPDARAA